MRLLFISANPPSLGRSGGATILYHYLKGLAVRHTVDLVTFQRPDESLPTDLRVMLNQVVIFQDPGERKALQNHLRGLAQGWPLTISRYYSPKAQTRVAEMMSQTHYDAVLCQMSSTLQFVPRPMPHTPCASVLFIEDPLSVKFRITPPWQPTLLGKAMTTFELSRVENYERRHWHTFDRVVMLNQLDIAACQKLYPQGQFEWLAYGVDADQFVPRPDITRDENKIVFSGQMSSEPNVKGILQFCNEIFPSIVMQRPATQLWIVGANPAPEVQALANRDARIHVTGFVKDMRDYLWSASVSVCPVQLGYGSQTKILEAMACGLPVVTWPSTNAGTGATPGQHLLVAETAADFASSVVKLLASPSYWQSISTQARQFIETERSWQVITSRLEQLLKTLMHTP